jgi:hypothetical protein
MEMQPWEEREKTATKKNYIKMKKVGHCFKVEGVSKKKIKNETIVLKDLEGEEEILVK